MENQKEIWKDVKGYEGRYQISNKGRVKSFLGKEERILSKSINPNGYFCLRISLNGIKKSKKIHRLVAEAFLGKSDLHVNHKDGNKTNNNIENLEFVTNRDNIIHANKSQKNSSKYVGAIWNKKHCKWVSTIYLNGKHKHLGYFDNELEAHNAYLKALKDNGIESKYA